MRNPIIATLNVVKTIKPKIEAIELSIPNQTVIFLKYYTNSTLFDSFPTIPKYSINGIIASIEALCNIPEKVEPINMNMKLFGAKEIKSNIALLIKKPLWRIR